MDLEKTFLKAFLKNFEEESFIVNLWDGEKVIVGEGEPQFTINIKNPFNVLICVFLFATTSNAHQPIEHVFCTQSGFPQS